MRKDVELLRKPLYIVTAGDLSITAAEVETMFGSVLDLCQTWDALVLMDEVDIFLENAVQYGNPAQRIGMRHVASS